jgi:hypothetical protein
MAEKRKRNCPDAKGTWVKQGSKRNLGAVPCSFIKTHSEGLPHTPECESENTLPKEKC